MANFNTAYAIVHANEGGYSNKASDKGGETYCGISRRWHKEWRGWPLVDTWKALHGTPKNNQYLDVPGLVDEVVHFYKASWDEIGGDYLRSQSVANFLYDFATNSGRAVQVAQQTLVNLGFVVTVDNQFGPKTLAAINNCDPTRYFNALKLARIAYLHYLVKQDPAQAVNLSGWLVRVNRFLYAEKKTPVPSRSVA